MLVKLFVQNYALIKSLDLELEKGLTIITGETGAGKSILLGALSLILGSRADVSVLLEKNRKCIVEGSFRIDGYELDDFFEVNELDFEPLTTIRREINPAGKSRGFINDTPVTLTVLKDIGDRLIDIHSQHQTLMLRDNSFHLSVIDSFAGTTGLLEKYRQVFQNFRRLKKELNELTEMSDKNKADLDYYQFQLEELDSSKLVAGEQDDLEKEQELLSHAEEIKIALSNASHLFSSDDGNSILVMLKEVKTNLSRIMEFIPEGEGLLQRADSAWIELNDLANELEKMAALIEADPNRLAEINERLDLIYSLLLKHRLNDLNELLNEREKIREKVVSIETNDERLKELQLLVDNETRLLNSFSEEISEKRNNILGDVEKKITDILKQLGMPDAKFKISLSRLKDFTMSGIDHADFLFSANKQTEPENIAKIASGGELSRVMLSLKSLLTRKNNLPTIIFDEIDSGVSGEIAARVGQILAGMGDYMQVLNITHLPQVASRGSRHYHVYKDEENNSAVTKIKLLSPQERIIEIARLLSGSQITETALKNARELLKTPSA
ncbi:MAG TPA: DNA repair protein RecN [Bacteroidales bacterium]|nr:DNA repair protein RecN [Bacteroidales bacterium]HPR73752.1 DNA repair protein RecN [Bacteroidales bacterium]